MIVQEDSDLEKQEKPLTGLIVFNFLLLLAVVFVYDLSPPIFGSMFADFGAKLPRLTVIFLDYAGYIGGFIALTVITLIILSSNRRLPRRTLVITLFSQILFLLGGIALIFLPIFNLGGQ